MPIAATTYGEIDGRHDAEPHFGQRELRSLHADGDVRARDEADAAAEHVAVDACDDGLVELVERAQAARQEQGIVDVLLLGRAHHRAHVSDVGAGAEARACARHDDDACLRIVGERRERGVQLLHRRAVERVVLVGTIQRQRRHAARIDIGGDERHRSVTYMRSSTS